VAIGRLQLCRAHGGGSRKKGATRLRLTHSIGRRRQRAPTLGQGPPVGEEYGDRSPCKRIVHIFRLSTQLNNTYVINIFFPFQFVFSRLKAGRALVTVGGGHYSSRH
jgi:hypothetical protein